MPGGKEELEVLVDRVYDIAVAPERLEQLIDIWSRQLGEGGKPPRFNMLAEQGVFDHVTRAERVMERLIAADARAQASFEQWGQGAMTAAFVVNAAGTVVTANKAAQQSLGLVAGATISRLPVVDDDLAHLVERLNQPKGNGGAEGTLVRLRMRDGGAPMLVRIVRPVDGEDGHAEIVTSIMDWPDSLSAQMKGAFSLTPAEVEVLKDLALGLAVKEIATRTGRTEATLRSHVKSLLEKTGARSQIELIRMTLGLLVPSTKPPRIVPLLGAPDVQPESNRYEAIILPDGRKLEYLVVGAPEGRPFLMLPTDMGFTRLPPVAEAWLSGQGVRMIVPVRAGYGGSSPLPRGRSAFEVAIADMLELCNALEIERCPLLALCDDFHLAVATACTAPTRVTAIIGVGPTMPASAPKHYQRMPKWTRFIFATSRYAPRTLPYVALAFMQCIRAMGPKRFMQTVLAESKADQLVLEDKETLTAMLRGSEIAIGPRFSAHVAWAAGAIANYAVDWSDKLAACPVPMILFAGTQDPFAPIETTREFAAASPRIILHEFPARGQLLYPEWQKFLGEVEQRLAD